MLSFLNEKNMLNNAQLLIRRYRIAKQLGYLSPILKDCKKLIKKPNTSIRVIGVLCGLLAEALIFTMDSGSAEKMAEKALKIFVEDKDRKGQSWSFGILSQIYRQRGDLPGVEEMSSKAISVWPEMYLKSRATNTRTLAALQRNQGKDINSIVADMYANFDALIKSQHSGKQWMLDYINCIFGLSIAFRMCGIFDKANIMLNHAMSAFLSEEVKVSFVPPVCDASLHSQSDSGWFVSADNWEDLVVNSKNDCWRSMELVYPANGDGTRTRGWMLLIY